MQTLKRPCPISMNNARLRFVELALKRGWAPMSKTLAERLLKFRADKTSSDLVFFSSMPLAGKKHLSKAPALSIWLTDDFETQCETAFKNRQLLKAYRDSTWNLDNVKQPTFDSSSGLPRKAEKGSNAKPTRQG